MNTGGGVTISMNGHDNPWVVHGGDAGVIRAWEITSQSNHELAWTSEAGENDNLLYSLEGGKSYGVAMGNLDDDDNLEIVVGSGSGRVYVFDGNTHETQWVSPVLDKLPIGVAIGDLNDNGNNEIAITTGLPAEPKGERYYSRPLSDFRNPWSSGYFLCGDRWRFMGRPDRDLS